jgi:hypothetical protein
MKSIDRAWITAGYEPQARPLLIAGAQVLLVWFALNS